MTADLPAPSVGPSTASVAERGRLRILWLCPYLPLPIFGAGSRVFNLLRVLAATSKIDLIATTNCSHEIHPLAAELRELCHSVVAVPFAAASEAERRRLQVRSMISRRPAQFWTTYSEQMQARIDEAVRTTKYDLAIVEHSFTGYYRLPSNIPIVLDQHNVESEILDRASRHDRSLERRVFNRLEFWKYRLDERRVCRDADLVLTASARDRDAVQAWPGVGACAVIPNGVDVQTFRPGTEDEAERPGSIIFTGPLHYSPNAEAVLYLHSQIWPLIRRRAPGAQLTIVGSNPPREIARMAEEPGITIAGFVPDVRPYLARAQVVVAPLRIGGGTRLKILEAFAMRRAVVSTSVGCEGLEVRPGQHLLVADEPEPFAESVIELLGNAQLREDLAGEGRGLVEERYDWQAIGQEMNTAVRALCAAQH